MAADSDWENLPSIIIVEILNYLPVTDRLTASSVCSRWRHCLFHPYLWKSIHFKVHNKEKRRAKHLADVCGRFIRDAIVSFDSKNVTNVNEFLRILRIFENNSNLERLSLKPSSCSVQWPVVRSSITFPKDHCIDSLSEIIRNSRSLRSLSLGCIGDLTDHCDYILALLAQHQADKLEHLHIESVKEDPDSYGLICLPSHHLKTFTNLKILGIDYDYVTNDLLLGFCSNTRGTILEQLIIHVHGIDPDQEKISNSTWTHVVAANPEVEVTLNLIHSVDGAYKLLDILQPALPLVHFRQFFCQHLNVAAINFISHHCGTRLRTIHIVDGITYEYGPALYDFHTDEDPFVMMAWKCKNLTKFTLIGYAVDYDDVVAFARLRGSTLKDFYIPESCVFDFSEEDTHLRQDRVLNDNILRNISNHLGVDNWRPLRDSQLHPAVLHENADAETAYLHTLLDDQAW